MSLAQLIQKEITNVAIETKCINKSKTLLNKLVLKRYAIIIIDLDFKTPELMLLFTNIKNKTPNVPLLFLDNTLNFSRLELCEKLNVKGYLIKSEDINLIPAITTLLNGGVYSSSNLLELKPEFNITKQPKKLTKSEAKILQLIADGYNNLSIAQQLHVSTETIKTHKRNIRAKLGISSLNELIQYYRLYFE